jgi:hypothetical protein
LEQVLTKVSFVNFEPEVISPPFTALRYKVYFDKDDVDDNDVDNIDDDDVDNVDDDDVDDRNFYLNKKKCSELYEMARNVINFVFFGSVGGELRVLACADKLVRTPLGMGQSSAL